MFLMILILAESLYRSQNISDGRLVLAKCEYNEKKIEFLALITIVAYSNKRGKLFSLISATNFSDRDMITFCH